MGIALAARLEGEGQYNSKTGGGAVSTMSLAN